MDIISEIVDNYPTQTYNSYSPNHKTIHESDFQKIEPWNENSFHLLTET